jgi:hypothetical protein
MVKTMDRIKNIMKYQTNSLFELVVLQMDRAESDENDDLYNRMNDIRIKLISIRDLIHEDDEIECPNFV